MIVQKKSFTLVEAMIAASITAILMMALTAAVIQTQRIFSTSDITATLSDNARSGLIRLAHDLRRATPETLIDPQWYQINITQDYPSTGIDSIAYNLPVDTNPSDGVPDLDANGDIIWDNSSTTVSLDTNSNKLIKDYNNNATVLIKDVVGVNFVDHTIDSSLPLDNLKIVLNLSKTNSEGRPVNVSSTSVINLRN